MPEEEARMAALRSFGGVTQTREQYRAERGLLFLNRWLEIFATRHDNCVSIPDSLSPLC